MRRPRPARPCLCRCPRLNLRCQRLQPRRRFRPRRLCRRSLPCRWSHPNQRSLPRLSCRPRHRPRHLWERSPHPFLPRCCRLLQPSHPHRQGHLCPRLPRFRSCRCRQRRGYCPHHHHCQPQVLSAQWCCGMRLRQTPGRCREYYAYASCLPMTLRLACRSDLDRSRPRTRCGQGRAWTRRCSSRNRHLRAGWPRG